MNFFTAKDFDNHEHVSFFHNPRSGLKAVIAIHNTKRGPALGGCRMWNYASDEEALVDALRLARGMTYKSAMANLPYGGGKSVIIGDSKNKTPALFEDMGSCVERLGGHYIISEDVGVTTADAAHMMKNTKHVVGVAGKSGDPSPVTAYGVYQGMKATMRARLGHENINSIKVSVQGLGHVGMELCRLLSEDTVSGRTTAEIIVTDINKDYVKQAVDRFGAKAVEPDQIYDQEVDIYAPCALGGTLNDKTIGRLKATIVAGCANNQLGEARHGKALQDRKILYAPDYVINAGGLINVYHEREFASYDRKRSLEHVHGIYNTLLEVYQMSDSKKVPPGEAADSVAEQRFK
jgi:leucine dehydrogenase